MKESRQQPERIKVLIVCSGNTCRSPMAEAMLRELVEKNELSHRLEVASAGLMAGGGSGASPEAVAAMREQGLDISGHRSTQLDATLLRESDYILLMQSSHKALLEQSELVKTILGDTCLHLLSEFAPEPFTGSDISDPFGGGMDVYQQTLDEIRQCVEGFFRHVRSEHDLE